MQCLYALGIQKLLLHSFLELQKANDFPPIQVQLHPEHVQELLGDAKFEDIKILQYYFTWQGIPIVENQHVGEAFLISRTGRKVTL